MDYTLPDSVDGSSKFEGAEILQDRVMLDNQLLIDYITRYLGGMIGEPYENPYGDGRITIVEEMS